MAPINCVPSHPPNMTLTSASEAIAPPEAPNSAASAIASISKVCAPSWVSRRAFSEPANSAK
jgi:hypothetical protein